MVAQREGTWTPPVLLWSSTAGKSDVPERASYPVVVTDGQGSVHAFWSAIHDANATIGDTLFYAFWDGTAWSIPTDILYTPGRVIWVPKVAIDPKGWLHLVWTDNSLGQIWHTEAPVTEAELVSAWAEPVPVSDDRASGVSMAIDGEGIVHLVYCRGGRYSGVYHTSSADGQRWLTPDYVGRLGDYQVELPECKSAQAIDAKGRLHAVWGQSLAVGTPVYYARSEDGGLNWKEPFEVDRKDGRYAESYAPGRPNILAIGSDEIHLVWFGAPRGQRWHRWSEDGGDTWSAAEQLSPLLRSFVEPPALAADSAGTLHLLSMGWLETEERPFGAFHAYWRDGHWSSLTLIERRGSGEESLRPSGSNEGGGEFAALAVTNGNRLHAVWELGLSEIWASSLQVDAPFTSPQQSSRVQVTPTAWSISPDAPITAGVQAQVAPSPTVTAPAFPLSMTAGSRNSSQLAVLASMLPVALLIALTVILHWARRRP